MCSHPPLSQRPGRVVPVLVAVLVAALTACGQTDYRQEAASVSAELTAAAATLQDAHTGRLPEAFARGSFVNYRSSLEGSEEELASATGAPRGDRLRQLLAVYRPALRAVEQPCLDGGCDWQAQVQAMRAARDALRQAAGP